VIAIWREIELEKLFEVARIRAGSREFVDADIGAALEQQVDAILLVGGEILGLARLDQVVERDRAAAGGQFLFRFVHPRVR
jgi:hypothetical protein